jgi:hypothetical protein
MGDLSDFEKGQIVEVHLAGASVIKSTTLLGVLRTTVSMVMSAYMNHGKTSVNRNSGRKSTLTKRDCRIFRRIVLKNHITAVAELNIHLEDHFHKNCLNVSSTNPTSMAGLQLLNL